jgi:hypothetical protein
MCGREEINKSMFYLFPFPACDHISEGKAGERHPILSAAASTGGAGPFFTNMYLPINLLLLMFFLSSIYIYEEELHMVVLIKKKWKLVTPTGCCDLLV